ncbi:ABC transporter permease [Gemmatimonadota bacterium]
MPSFPRDLRHSVRALIRAPRFTIIATLTLAIGIGANTAIFSAVNGVLLKPLPYLDSDRIVGLWHSAPDLGYDQFGISPGIFYEYASENQVFEEMGLYQGTGTTLIGDGDAEQITGTRINHTLFKTLQVSPLIGRSFTREEDLPDGPHLVIISHALWQTRYGGDPDILSRSINLYGEAFEVIGVMPAGFNFAAGRVQSQYYVPVRIDPENVDPGSFSYSAIARLKPGYSADQALAQMDVGMGRVRERWADGQMFINFLDAGGFRPVVHSLQEEIVGDIQRPLLILLGTVGFILLIACANVANLFLVRVESRQREMAIRSALGANRWAVMRLFLSESLILATIGGMAGVTLAWVGTPALLGLAPPELPRLNEVTMDFNVLMFAALVTLLSAVLFGIAPAMRHSARNLLGTLKSTGRGSTSSRANNRMRNLLVVLQTGMAMILLVGSGLLVRSFWEIRQTDPGFESEDILTFSLVLMANEYPDAVSHLSFSQQLLERLRGLPGVQNAGGISDIPLADGPRGTAFDIEDLPTGPDELARMFWFKYATPGYFDAMDISIVNGRDFEPADYEQIRGNIIVSQPLVDRYWPDQNVLGKRIRFNGATSDSAWLQIVGVTEGLRDHGLREEPSETIYLPIVNTSEENGWLTPNLTYTIHGQNAIGLTQAVRDQVRDMNPNLPIARMRLMDEIVSDSIVQLSFTMIALGVAACMALLLGAIGLYGVLSYVVSQRRQEIGVRMALGAAPAMVLRMIVISGARIAVIGLIVGLIGSVVLTRLLQSLLYGTEPLDPITFVAMALILFATGLLASYLPARKAAAVDPMESLRIE